MTTKPRQKKGAQVFGLRHPLEHDFEDYKDTEITDTRRILWRGGGNSTKENTLCNEAHTEHIVSQLS